MNIIIIIIITYAKISKDAIKKKYIYIYIK